MYAKLESERRNDMKRVKKTLLFVLVIMAGSVVLSCASSKGTSQDAIDSAFDKLYHAYYAGLILDGASAYTVKAGDTLAGITRNNWGGKNGFFFPVIMLASPDAVVADPDLIFPGMELTIPDLQKNLDDPKARQNIKDFLNEIATVYDKKGQNDVRDALKDLAKSL
jgi:nucleoid-associated protein YgaU